MSEFKRKARPAYPVEFRQQIVELAASARFQHCGFGSKSKTTPITQLSVATRRCRACPCGSRLRAAHRASCVIAPYGADGVRPSLAPTGFNRSRVCVGDALDLHIVKGQLSLAFG
jgi:hypothetical protein